MPEETKIVHVLPDQPKKPPTKQSAVVGTLFWFVITTANVLTSNGWGDVLFGCMCGVVLACNVAVWLLHDRMTAQYEEKREKWERRAIWIAKTHTPRSEPLQGRIFRV